MSEVPEWAGIPVQVDERVDPGTVYVCGVCPQCDGKGKIEHMAPQLMCPNCSGTGIAAAAVINWT